tara:strand:- start:9650 stop:11155 length:1506 start_codon:yes stop_codon:yes gene_type:complete
MADNKSFFGFEFKKKAIETNKKPVSFAVDNEDGAYEISPTGGYFGQYMDLGGDKFQSDKDLIMKYRAISSYPEVDMAIEDICNEAITDENGIIVRLNLDELDQKDSVKELIMEEFDRILNLTNFSMTAYDTFRRWYIDGRLFYHVVINEAKPDAGILELRQIDPTKIRKIKEVEKVKDPKTGAELTKEGKEYYLFQDDAMVNNSEGLKINPDSIIQVNSGLLNDERTKVVGYLNKALKPLNQLSMMEDSLVIYRISRAPERRIFYIDVGNLPKGKAEEYLNSTMNKYRNKIVYDPSTGAIKDEKIHRNVMEDFWLPRREGGRGTEISTLPGGQNLGEIEDVQYFQNKLYRALNIPMSRLSEGDAFSIGRSSEITRDELKFQKFIDRCRGKFSTLFYEALKRQLILKKIIVPSDWVNIREEIVVEYSRDNYYAELKDSEILKERIEMVQMMDEYIGTFWSKDWVRRNILKLTDEDIKQIAKDNKEDPMEPGDVNPDLVKGTI